jgi:methylisocitrate lyase
MCAKLRAAAAARCDKQTVILARTDARGVDGFDAAVERAKRYLDAGADWIFPEALETPDEFAKFAKAVPVPLVANMTEFGRSPLLSRDELTQLGYAAALLPVTTLRIAMRAVEQALKTIAAGGTQKSLVENMQTRQELYELLGYSDFEARDKSYFQGEAKS